MKELLSQPYPFQKDQVKLRDKLLTHAELPWLQVGSSEL